MAIQSLIYVKEVVNQLKKSIFLFLIFFHALVTTLPIFATENQISLENHLPNAIYVGNGTYAKFGFEIYKAHFYVDENKIPKRFALSLDYLRNIEKDSLIKNTIEQLERLGYSQTKTEEWKNQLEKIFPNVNKGDKLTAVFNPQQGTSFFYGDKIIGKVLGDEFAKAFFGIWLSTKTTAPELRSKLLANSCPPAVIQSTCQ